MPNSPDSSASSKPKPNFFESLSKKLSSKSKSSNDNDSNAENSNSTKSEMFSSPNKTVNPTSTSSDISDESLLTRARSGSMASSIKANFTYGPHPALPQIKLPRAQTEPASSDEALVMRPALNRATSSFRSLAGMSGDENDVDTDATVLTSETVNILLREAAADTPSFRASVLTTHEQIMKFDSWLNDLETSTQMIAKRVEALRETVKGYCGVGPPQFVQKSLMDNDSIALLLGRFGESHMRYWSTLVGQSSEAANEVHRMAQKFREHLLNQYLLAKTSYDKVAAEYHMCLYAFVRLPPEAEPVAFRDTVLSLRKAKWNFARASTALVVQIQRFQSESTVILLETLSSKVANWGPSTSFTPDTDNLYEFLQQSPSHSEQKHSKITAAAEFHRLRSLGRHLRKTLPDAFAELRTLRHHLLEEIHPKSVNDDLKEFEQEISPDSLAPLTSKCGWVFVLHSDNKYYPLYAFALNGIFGLLSISNNAVSESNKYPINGCTVTPHESSSRKNLMKVQTESDSIVMQAIGCKDYAEWLNVFENGKMEVPATFMRPWNAKYSVSFINGVDDFDLADGYEPVSQRAAAIAHDMSEPDWLLFDGTLSYTIENKLVFTTPSVKPLPTNGMLDSLVGNWYFSPKGIPNSITANYWGTNSWIDYISLNEVRFKSNFPKYPKKYPRKMMIQDMDMRAVTDRLPNNSRPTDTEFLIFMLRGSVLIGTRETPCRVFVTNQNVFIYSYWAGFLDIKAIKLNKIVDVESEYSTECSELRLVVQNESTNADVITIYVYLDSAELARTRLDFLVTNSRNRTAISASEIFELMTVKSIAEVEAYRHQEMPIKNSLQWVFSHTIDGSSDKTNASTTKLGQGVHTKLSEDTFPLSARALFHVIFGPKSPVFNSTHDAAIDCEYTAGSWYKRGKKLERKVYLTYGNELKVLDEQQNEKQPTHTIVQQVITQKNKDLVVVVERRPSWETLNGEKFHLELKYFIYSTGTGSFTQIWCRTIWQNKKRSQTFDQTVEEISKMMVKPLAISIREAADAVSSNLEARKKYGDIYATKIVATNHEDHFSDSQIARLSTESYFRIMGKVPVRLVAQIARWMFWSSLAALQELSFTKMFMFATVVISLVMNVVLYRQSSVSYWSSKLDTDHTANLIQNLGLLPNEDTVLKRAIYDKDIEEALLSGGFWNQTADNLCTSKFSHLVAISSNIDQFKPVYDYEESILATTEEIEQLRLRYAIRRNELMTDIWILNSQEKEKIQEIYRNWLINETIMCSRVRPYLSILNTSVYDNIHEYCVSCLEEAQLLI